MTDTFPSSDQTRLTHLFPRVVQLRDFRIGGILGQLHRSYEVVEQV